MTRSVEILEREGASRLPGPAWWKKWREGVGDDLLGDDTVSGRYGTLCEPDRKRRFADHAELDPEQG